MMRSLLPVIVVLGLAAAGCRTAPRAADAAAGNPFGIHGPQYSHWLHGRHPHPWAAGSARLTVLADSGAGWARQDFWWSLVEPEKGEFRWDEFDRAIASYERHGVKLLVILCYGSVWTGGEAPQTDKQRDAFANYVYEMVKRYHDRVAAWEIWNEPNIQPYWSPRPDPVLYTQMLKQAYAAAKRADPGCVILGGALAGPDHVFLRGMYEAGAAGSFDALSYHNYGQQNEIETEWPAVARLRAIMAEHGEAEKPVWHTENGFYTGPVGLSEHEQAARLVRYSIGLLGLGLQRTFQLTLDDWTDDPQHHELSVYRGLTHSDYRPKPSFRAYQTMTARLGDKRHVATLRPAPGVHGFLFENDAESVLVLWRPDAEQPSPLELDAATPMLLVQQLFGDWELLENPTGRHTFDVGYDPMYVMNPGPPIANHRHVRWPSPLESSLIRDEAATLQLRVTNPTSTDLRFEIEHSEQPATRAARTVAAGRTEDLTLTVDTSRLEPGPHELAWRLRGPIEDARPFAAGYRRAQVEPPLTLSFAPLTKLDESAPEIPIAVDYHGARPSAATVRLRAGETVQSTRTNVPLTPGHRHVVSLPVDVRLFERDALTPLAVEVDAAGLKLTTHARKRLIACPPAPGAAEIDGDLAEWRDRAPQITPDMLYWEYANRTDTPASSDLAVTAWLGYDERGLRLALEVRDDTIALPQSRAIWNWDSVQIGLDLATDAQPDEGYDDNDLEIELGANENETWCYLGAAPPGWPADELSSRLRGVVRADRDAGILVYELLIPAELLVSIASLTPDTVIGFSLLVNDNDGAGRAGWQELTPGIGLGKRPEEFGWLWLR